jgi:hypothetical protein
MVLTRDFKQTVTDRARRDPAFARALCDEVLTLIRARETRTARAMLGGLADAAIGGEAPASPTRARRRAAKR